MLLRKKEYQPQNIRHRRSCMLLRRQEGQIQWATGLFFLLFLGILLCSQLQLLQYGAVSLYLEDALAASNLASAVIDLEEYGSSHQILIKEPRQAYEKFCQAVKGNLNLNEEWEGTNKYMISGTVKIVNFTVYNVYKEKVTILSVMSDGEISMHQGALGSVRAPNGVVIEATSVYSEISFPIKGLFNIEAEANKGKLVDIVAGVA